jgi:hypothetical protein
MGAGILFIILCAAVTYEFTVHRSTKRKVQFVADRRGRVHYLPGASRRAAEHKPEPPHSHHSKGGMRLVGLALLFSVAFFIASVLLWFLATLL